MELFEPTFSSLASHRVRTGSALQGNGIDLPVTYLYLRGVKYYQSALASVGELRETLAALIRRATEAEAYEEVAAIASLAAELKQLLDESSRGDIASSAPLTLDVHANGDSAAKVARETAKLSPSPASREFPRFEKERDRLVKIGWSTRDRRSYEHRAPRAAVAAVAAEVSKAGRAGRLFAVEDVLPVKLPSGEEIPSYQVYLTLGLLRHLGLVERKGKDGYALANGRIGSDQFTSLWDSIPEHI